MQPQRCLRCRSTWTERKLSPRSRQSSGRSRKVVGDCAGGFGFTWPPAPFLALLQSTFASSSSQPPPLTRRPYGRRSRAPPGRSRNRGRAEFEGSRVLHGSRRENKCRCEANASTHEGLNRPKTGPVSCIGVRARHGLTWCELDINWYGISALRMLGLAWDVKVQRLNPGASRTAGVPRRLAL